MNPLRIGKSEDTGLDRLHNIRKRLMGKGAEISNHDSPSPYAEAMEMTMNAVFEDVPELVEDALEVLENPPSTWNRYVAMHDGKHIYEMEFGELREAIKRDIRSGRSELNVHKEMTHVLAAALYMALIDNK